MSLPLSPTTTQPLHQKQPSSVPLRIFATCFTALTIAVHYTNYSPLIAIMRSELHINSGQIGLFSTLLFIGLAIAYIPGGILADRLGARPVLIGSCTVMGLGAILLPLFPNLIWMLACRVLIGLGSGSAFVAGAGITAGLGKHAALGTGLYGGTIQVGSGLGLLVTPHLQPIVGWRGSLLFWGILSATAVLLWLFVNDGQEVRASSPINFKGAIRSPAIWALGLSHMGTFGLGNTIAAWITVYLVMQYSLPLALAASIGSVALLGGVIFRPLGGILLARKVIGAIPLLRLGTIMGAVGVGLLAVPVRFAPFAIIGLVLIAIGSTIPYTSVFNAAANLRSVRKGIAQGLVSVISTPTVIIGPPLIGFLVDRTGNFLLAFGSILLFGCVAVTASLLAGPILKHDAITQIR